MICSSVCPFLGILPPSAFVQRTTSGCRTQPPSCLIFGFWVSPYTSLEELERDIQEFIDQTYNRVRLHSALTYLSPEQFEARQAQAKTTPPWLPAVLSLSRHEEVSPGPAPLSGGQP